MKPNPITQHLTRNHRWPSLRGAGLIGLGLCAVTMTGFALGIDLIKQIGLAAACMTIVINPVFLAFMSPILVWQTSRDEQFQLLKENLSPNEIQHGFVLAILFRMRVQLAMQIGLMPVWVAAIISQWSVLWLDLYQSASSFFFLYGSLSEKPNIATPLIVLSLIATGVFGLNLIAAGFGVRQSLRSGQPEWSIAVSLGASLLVPVLCYIPGMTFLGPRDLALWRNLSASLLEIGVVFVSFVLPTYGLVALLYWPLEKNLEARRGTVCQMKPNPITLHLIRNHRPPSLRSTILIGLVLGMLSWAISAADIPQIKRISLAAISILMLLNPLAIAVQAPLLARPASGDEQYQLLKLATLSSAKIRQGFVQATLFRARVLLAVQIGLLPMWVDGVFYRCTNIQCPPLYTRPLGEGLIAAPLTYPNYAAPMIVIALLGIGMFGLNILAAVFGTKQGQTLVSPARSIAASLGGVMLIPLWLFSFGLVLMGSDMPLLLWGISRSRRAIGTALGFFVLPPYTISASLFWPVEKK